MGNFGQQGLNLAATAAATAAVKDHVAVPTCAVMGFLFARLTAVHGAGTRTQPRPTSTRNKKEKKSSSSQSVGYGIPLKDRDEKTDEEADGPHSGDVLTLKGL